MLALVAVTLFAAAAADDAAAGLARNAWYWQARSRADKAEDAWKQVREAMPDHPEALAALGGFDARAGRLDKAHEALARLEKVSPDHPDVAVLRREIELGPRYGAMLAEARKLFHEGRQIEAAGKYRALFGDAGPPGDLALEYYQTIAATPGSGWDEARAGFTKLMHRAPGEPRFKLALGKLLTYREETRREGIQLLAGLARDPAAGKEAVAAWRQALLWLSPSQPDVALLRAYAKTHPSDPEIARHLERARKAGIIKEGFAALDRGELGKADQIFRGAGDDPDARRGIALIAARRAAETRKAGFAALEKGELRTAQQLFEQAGDDPDARLGLALVAQKEAVLAQKEEDFARARTLLLRSQRLAPQRRDLWEGPLLQTTFWSLMRDAETARAQGRADQAEALLSQAIASAPKGERWHADLALANLSFERGQREISEGHYRDVLAVVPDQPEALRALAVLLVQTARFEEAIPVNDRLLKVAPQQAYPAGWLRSEVLRSRALKARREGEPMQARALLADARQADPGNVWVLHDLANVLLEASAPDAAAPVVDDLARLAPERPEVRLLRARLLAAQGRTADAYELLRGLALKDASAVSLRRRLELQLRLAEVLEGASDNHPGAVRRLAALQAEFGDAPELAALVSVAWSKLGERKRAVALMREAMAKAPSATRGARLELASALLQAGDDETLSQILAGLERETRLSAGERKSLGELRIAHAVRVADRSRETGDPEAAGAALEPLVREYPQDPRVLGALARLMEHDDAAQANALFRKVLAVDARDPDARRGAVDTSLALGRIGDARDLANAGVALRPADPRARLDRAHVALAESDDGEAMGALEEALSLTRAVDVEPSASTAPPGEGTDLHAAFTPGTEPLRPRILREMDEIRSRHRPGFTGAGEGRSRQGEAGLSALTELRGSATAEVPVNYAGRIVLRASQVRLDAGTPTASASQRFGTGGGAAPAQSAMGTELGGSVEGRNLSAWVGTSPLGFPVFSLLFGGRARATLGPLTAGLEAGRRPVTESLLSWAGTTDPGSGRRWGGVVMDGGRLDLSLAAGPVTFFGWGEGHRLIGLNVADNQRLAGGGGIELTLLRGDLGEIRAGPSALFLGFDKNLRFFTFGHGGYFSPQRFAHGGLLFEWRRSGSVRWEAVAEPGYDAFIEAVTPAFPLSSDQRSMPPYPGRTSEGLSFNGHARLGFEIVSGFEAALMFAVQQAPQFQEVRGGLVLRIGGAP